MYHSQKTAIADSIAKSKIMSTLVPIQILIAIATTKNPT
jgi:hypothetical protein